MRWRGALGHGVAGERCGWAGAATGPPPDAVNAAPASWRRWSPLRVSRGAAGGVSLGPPGGLRQRAAVKRVRKCEGRGPARPPTRRWT